MRCQGRIIAPITAVARSHPSALNPYSAVNSVCQHQANVSAAPRVTCYASGASTLYDDRDRQEKFETKRLMDDAEARMQEIMARVRARSYSVW